MNDNTAEETRKAIEQATKATANKQTPKFAMLGLFCLAFSLIATLISLVILFSQKSGGSIPGLFQALALLFFTSAAAGTSGLIGLIVNFLEWKNQDVDKEPRRTFTKRVLIANAVLVAIQGICILLLMSIISR